MSLIQVSSLLSTRKYCTLSCSVYLVKVIMVKVMLLKVMVVKVVRRGKMRTSTKPVPCLSLPRASSSSMTIGYLGGKRGRSRNNRESASLCTSQFV